MNSTLTPRMEVVQVPGVISGTSIIQDLLRRIGDKLSRDCSLRSTDAYSGYSFRCELQIQLHDVYPLEVVAHVAAGTIDPQLPSAYLDLGTEVAAPVETQPSLERPIDPAGFIEEPVRAMESRSETAAVDVALSLEKPVTGAQTPRQAVHLSEKATLWEPPKS